MITGTEEALLWREHIQRARRARLKVVAIIIGFIVLWAAVCVAIVLTPY